MASVAASSTALFLALNLLFCSVVTSTHSTGAEDCNTCGNGGRGGGGSGNGGGGSGNGGGGSGNGGGGSGNGGGGSGNGGGGSGNGGGGSGNGGNGNGARCPRDALKLGVCANVLNLVNVVVGSPPTLPCCSLLRGLVDLEAAVCLCTAIRANILGINLNVPLSLSLVLNNCGRRVPSGFQC